jgi:hypothetical protein
LIFAYDTWAAPATGRVTLYLAAFGRSTEPREKIAGLGPCGLRSLPLTFPIGWTADIIWHPKLSPGPSTMAALLHHRSPLVGYNVCMFTEEDESPAVTEPQPSDPEDQLDDDLMRDLEQKTGRQLASPQ